jgi:hypothetical protein
VQEKAVVDYFMTSHLHFNEKLRDRAYVGKDSDPISFEYEIEVVSTRS